MNTARWREHGECVVSSVRFRGHAIGVGCRLSPKKSGVVCGERTAIRVPITTRKKHPPIGIEHSPSGVEDRTERTADDRFKGCREGKYSCGHAF